MGASETAAAAAAEAQQRGLAQGLQLRQQPLQGLLEVQARAEERPGSQPAAAGLQPEDLSRYMCAWPHINVVQAGHHATVAFM